MGSSMPVLSFDLAAGLALPPFDELIAYATGRAVAHLRAAAKAEGVSVNQFMIRAATDAAGRSSAPEE